MYTVTGDFPVRGDYLAVRTLIVSPAIEALWEQIATDTTNPEGLKLLWGHPGIGKTWKLNALWALFVRDAAIHAENSTDVLAGAPRTCVFECLVTVCRYGIVVTMRDDVRGENCRVKRFDATSAESISTCFSRMFEPLQSSKRALLLHDTSSGDGDADFQYSPVFAVALREHFVVTVVVAGSPEIRLSPLTKTDRLIETICIGLPTKAEAQFIVKSTVGHRYDDARFEELVERFGCVPRVIARLMTASDGDVFVTSKNSEWALVKKAAQHCDMAQPLNGEASKIFHLVPNDKGTSWEKSAFLSGEVERLYHEFRALRGPDFFKSQFMLADRHGLRASAGQFFELFVRETIEQNEPLVIENLPTSPTATVVAFPTSKTKSVQACLNFTDVRKRDFRMWSEVTVGTPCIGLTLWVPTTSNFPLINFAIEQKADAGADHSEVWLLQVTVAAAHQPTMKQVVDLRAAVDALNAMKRKVQGLIWVVPDSQASLTTWQPIDTTSYASNAADQQAIAWWAALPQYVSHKVVFSKPLWTFVRGSKPRKYGCVALDPSEPPNSALIRMGKAKSGLPWSWNGWPDGATWKTAIQTKA